MAESKYDRYFLKKPWGIIHPGSDPDAPAYIGIGQKAPVEGWDDPLVQVLRPIYKPYKMIPDGHRHAVAEILYFIGGDPMKLTSLPIQHGCMSRRTCSIAP